MATKITKNKKSKKSRNEVNQIKNGKSENREITSSSLTITVSLTDGGILPDMIIFDIIRLY